MPAFGGKPGFEARQGPEGFGYYSDDENFGDTRDAMPFGIMGIIANAINKFKKPKDMTEFNKLGLGGVHPAALDFNPDAKIQNTAFSKTLSDPFKYGVGPVPPSDKYKYSDGPRAVNVPDSPEWTSWEVPPGMMSDAAQENVEFFDNLNKGIVKNNNTPMLNTDNLLQGSVIDQQPKKGIMQMISDAIFSPAGAAEIDFSKLSQASDAFTPEWQSGAAKNLAVQDWIKANPNPTKNDFINAIQSGTLGAATPGAFKENVGSLFEGVNLDQSWNPMDATPTLIGTNDATWRQAIDVDKDALEQEAIDALPGGFFKAKGGRVGYANGGLATLFTRRG